MEQVNQFLRKATSIGAIVKGHARAIATTLIKCWPQATFVSSLP
jgi:hypothetical protein